MLTQPSHKGRLSQDLNLWHSVPGYLIFSVIKATQHPVNSATARPWYMTRVGTLAGRGGLGPVSCQRSQYWRTALLLDAWLLGHTLGINQKTLRSPLDFKEIKPVNPKRNESWIFTGRTDAEAEAPILWTLDAKSWLTGKDPHSGKDWRQEENGGGCRGWDG